MILGFAQFGKQSRKLKNISKKQSRKSNELNMKNHQKREPKWSRKPWKKHKKNDTFFKDPKNHLQTTFLEGPCANINPKVRFLTGFGPQLGPRMVPEWSLGAPIFGQRSSSLSRTVRITPTGSRPGCDLVPKTLHGCIFINCGAVFGWFWNDVGQFWDGFSMTLFQRSWRNNQTIKLSQLDRTGLPVRRHRPSQ